MRVLYVDQFGKTSGCYSLPQADYIYKNEKIDITEFISDNIDFSLEKYSVNIVKGFSGAYVGNVVHKTLNYLKGLKELKKYIIDNSIDIVHLQWFSLPWIEWLYVKNLKKYCKVIVTIHDVVPFNNRPFEMKALDIIYDSADYLLFHTEFAREDFKHYYSAKTRSKIITQGFCKKGDYTRINKKEAKDYFGIPYDSVVFLYYGTIRKSKGLDILLKAIAKASESNEKIHLLAGGAFQKVDESKLLELASLIPDKNKTINFSFISTYEEPYYFSAADVVCLPYREITQSGVAQNALMYELPIIASDIGSLKEVVRPGVNGELIEPDSIDSLYEAIMKISIDKELICNYSQASKVIAENDFSLEKKSSIVAEVYRELMGD